MTSQQDCFIPSISDYSLLALRRPDSFQFHTSASGRLNSLGFHMMATPMPIEAGPLDDRSNSLLFLALCRMIEGENGQYSISSQPDGMLIATLNGVGQHMSVARAYQHCSAMLGVFLGATDGSEGA